MLYLSCLFYFYLLFAIFFTTYMLSKDSSMLELSFAKKKYGILIENLRFYRSKYAKYWYPCHLLRRFLFVIILFKNMKHGHLQLIYLVYLQTLYLIVYGVILDQPLNTKDSRNRDLFTEFIFLQCLVAIIGFSDFVPCLQTEYQVGNYFLFLLLAVLVVHIVIETYLGLKV